MAKPYSENREVKPNLSHIPLLTHPTSQIYLQEDPYQLQNENEFMTKTNMTNPEEDHFNESLITLLSDQQDLQKQSLNMMLDITCRHEYDNVMRNIPIYDGKNMKLADWQLQIEKVASLTHSQEYKQDTAKSTSVPYKMPKD